MRAASARPAEWSGSLFLLVDVQAVVQRVQADAEDLGGRALVAVEVSERAHDQLPLDLADRTPDLQTLEPVLLTERALETLRQDDLAVVRIGQDERPVDHMAQLADVSGPVIGFESLDRLVGEPPVRPVPLRELVQEVVREKRDVG